MVHTYIPTPKVSAKCDLCKKGKKYKYLVVDDYTQIVNKAITICKRCYKKHGNNK